MLLVDSFAQAYHWDMDYILKLTMPQIIMVNHAAETNKKRMDARLDKAKRNGTQTLPEKIAGAPVYKGKRLNELSSADYKAWLESANSE